MLKYASETWAQVRDEFDELGRRNFEECKIAEGRRPYNLAREAFNWLDAEGMVHVTTARNDGKLVGYVLTVLQARHLQFDAFCSQTIGMYMLPAYRKGLNAVRMMEMDEQYMRGLGVDKMYGGCTHEKELAPLFIRRGWVPAETHYHKWIGA